MIDFDIFTDIGDRPVNEDTALVCDHGERFFCILCDGLGGHGMGDMASKLVCGSVKKSFDSANKIDSSFLPEAFANAEKELLKKQEELNAKNKMKTTAVAIVFNGKKVFVSHVGDTRLYYFRKNKIAFRTLDHSIPQMLCIAGDITEKEIRNHPDRSTLMRVLGVNDEIEIENHKPFRFHKGDAVLMCSDGFWELIEDETMCEMLTAASTAREWLNNMSTHVKNNGKGKNMDNNTAIALRIV